MRGWRDRALAWRALSPWRRHSGGVCVLSAVAWWVVCGLGGLRLPLWVADSLAGFAGLVVLSVVLSSERPGRRSHLNAALLLLITALLWRWGAASAWCLEFRSAFRVLWASPSWSTAWSTVGSTWVAQAQATWPWPWWVGLPDWPWPFWCLVAPAMALSLAQRGADDFVAPPARALAAAGLALWLLALLMKLGYLFVVDWRSVPTWFLAFLAVGAFLQARGDAIYAAVPIMLASGAAWLCRLLDIWHLSAPVLQALVVLALLVTAVSWLLWYLGMPTKDRLDEFHRAAQVLAQAQKDHAQTMPVRSDAPPVSSPTAPAFDLNAHLDSPQAQEGADKYTRE